MAKTLITDLSTVVVPVADQQRALAFYVEVLGLEVISDFAYPTGERWLEVAPPSRSISLTLAAARPERPAGIETGVILATSDLAADLALLAERGADVDPAPLPAGEVRFWAGAALAGRPPQALVRDEDGNSLLLVQAG